jgi:hypothetical protein
MHANPVFLSEYSPIILVKSIVAEAARIAAIVRFKTRNSPAGSLHHCAREPFTASPLSGILEPGMAAASGCSVDRLTY